MTSLYKYSCCEQGERVEGDEVNISYGRLDPIDVGESRLWDLEITQGGAPKLQIERPR